MRARAYTHTHTTHTHTHNVQNSIEQSPHGAHQVTQMPAVAICKKHMLIWQVICFLISNSIEEIVYIVKVLKNNYHKKNYDLYNYIAT